MGPHRVHLQASNETKLLPWNLLELTTAFHQRWWDFHQRSSHCKCPLACGRISPPLKMATPLVDSAPPNTQWDHTLNVCYSRCPLNMPDLLMLSEIGRLYALPPGTLVTVSVCLLQVYLLILSVTTLSLLLAPVLWKAAITKCVPRPERRSSL